MDINCFCDIRGIEYFMNKIKLELKGMGLVLGLHNYCNFSFDDYNQRETGNFFEILPKKYYLCANFAFLCNANV